MALELPTQSEKKIVSQRPQSDTGKKGYVPAPPPSPAKPNPTPTPTPPQKPKK